MQIQVNQYINQYINQLNPCSNQYIAIHIINDISMQYIAIHSINDISMQYIAIHSINDISMQYIAIHSINDIHVTFCVFEKYLCISVHFNKHFKIHKKFMKINSKICQIKVQQKFSKSSVNDTIPCTKSVPMCEADFILKAGGAWRMQGRGSRLSV